MLNVFLNELTVSASTTELGRLFHIHCESEKRHHTGVLNFAKC